LTEFFFLSGRDAVVRFRMLNIIGTYKLFLTY